MTITGHSFYKVHGFESFLQITQKIVDWRVITKCITFHWLKFSVLKGVQNVSVQLTAFEVGLKGKKVFVERQSYV